MCFSSQPSAPINKPSYSTQDAYKHFDVSRKVVEGEKTETEQTDTTASSPTGPKIKRTNESIRM